VAFVYNEPSTQQSLFGTMTSIGSKTLEDLQNSWAQVFRDHIFPAIDESLFEPLYSDFGRPNFPVNIFVALEIIKHMKNYTDEELFEAYKFDLQVAYAVGLQFLGEKPFAERTFYDFRKRVYDYTLTNPENDLIFAQFQKLTAYFCELMNIDTTIQRMDSFQVASNIKIAGRLSLAVDVLIKGVRAIPEKLLAEELKPVVQSNYARRITYHSRSQDVGTRLDEVLRLIEQTLLLAQEHGLDVLEEIKLLARFLDEQTEIVPETKTRRTKDNKEIEAAALQSAHDPDATYRAKGNKKHHGFVANITETCSPENDTQIITDYDLNPNIKPDTEMLEERLPVIQEETKIEELVVDGGYYSGDLETEDVKVHHTDMTGSKENPDKVPLAEFEYNEDNSEVIACPAGQAPIETELDEKGNLTAHFDRSICESCPHQGSCRVQLQKNSAVLRTSQKAVAASQTRQEIYDPENRTENLSLRAGVEGTGSALKRAEGAGKLRVRGLTRCKVVFGFKVIGRNFKQFCRALARAPRKQKLALAV